MCFFRKSVVGEGSLVKYLVETVEKLPKKIFERNL